MYNRILNRPMFKLGGKTNDAQGTGITSGLDTPRSNYLGGGRTIGGGAFTGTPMGDRTGFQNIYESIDVSVPESTRKRAFWSGIGEGFSNARTLGEALRGTVQGQEKILGPAEAKAAERGFQLEKSAIDMPYERDTLVMLKELDIQGAIDVEKIRSSFENTATGGMIREVKNRKDLSQDQKHKMIEAIILKSNQPKLITNLAIAIMENATMTGKTMKFEDAMKNATNAIMLLMIDVGLPQAKGGLIYNKGGRAGYQFGTTNQGVQPVQTSLNVDETIQTPKGTMQEDMSIQGGLKPTVQMPYQEFRAAIPAEVSDEIVQLIYYNEDAFGDFSQITSQADVYAFNNKYGVSLVLPMDTETT